MSALETRLARPIQHSKLNLSAMTRGTLKPKTGSLATFNVEDNSISLGNSPMIIKKIEAEQKADYDN